MFKVNIDKWLKREIHATELALLKGEDALSEQQMRVTAFRARLARLKKRQEQRARQPAPAASPLAVRVRAARKVLTMQRRANGVDE